jgi:hypothetical protein
VSAGRRTVRTMTAGGGDDDGAIRNGIEAAEHWPDFAQESMDSQFDAVRHIGDGAPMPPLVPKIRHGPS